MLKWLLEGGGLAASFHDSGECRCKSPDHVPLRRHVVREIPPGLRSASVFLRRCLDPESIVHVLEDFVHLMPVHLAFHRRHAHGGIG